jgi:hypothetical protein
MNRRTLAPLFALTLAALPAAQAQPDNQKPDMLGEMVAGDITDSVTQKVRAKVEAGSRTAADFAPEIKELDEAIADFAQNKEHAARFTLMKAMIFAQAIGDLPRARQLLAAMKSDYPGTEAVGNVDQILSSLDEAIARDAAVPELRPLLEGIMSKASKGAKAEADFTPEIAKLDTLVAKYAAKPESAAEFALTKAMIHVQILQQSAKGRELLVALCAKYPGTKAATGAQQVITQLDAAAKR